MFSFFFSPEVCMSVPITGHTRLGGLLGSPVAHSISPMMHNDSFAFHKLDYVYLCFDIREDKLGTTIRALRDMNTYGFNLTMPDKTAVMGYLDEISVEARLIGAVNTVKNQDGKLIGFNTDGAGYMRAAADFGVDVTGRELTLIGAGGAANAIAVQSALDGAAFIHLVSRRGRSWDRARSLVDRINENTGCQAELIDLEDSVCLKSALERSVLLTNATSAGMAPETDVTPLKDTSLLYPELFVSDVIYNPRKTRFLREAQEAGCRTFNGLYMLLYQGEKAFNIWTGLDMPVQMIRERYFS